MNLSFTFFSNKIVGGPYKFALRIYNEYNY